jgi:hypothetical protein
MTAFLYRGKSLSVPLSSIPNTSNIDNFQEKSKRGDYLAAASRMGAAG